MNDDSDKDKKKQSLLSLSTTAAGAPRGAGSLLSEASWAREDDVDPVARHRAARARREAKPSPLLSALAAMEGFSAQPAPDTEVEFEAEPESDVEPRPEPVEESKRWWSLGGLLSSKVKPEPARQPEPPVAFAEAPAPAPPVDEHPAFVDEPPVVPDERPVRRPAWTAAEAPPARPVPEETFDQPAVAEAPAEVSIGPSVMPADDPRWRPLIDPLKVIGGVGRSKTLIVATTIIGAVIGVAVALSTPKKYTAIAELLVDPRDLKVSDRELTQTGLPSDATLALVENQVRVMTSGTVLNKAVDQLKLDEDSEFNGQRGGMGIGDIIGSLRALLSSGQPGKGDDRRHALAVNGLADSLTVERAGKTFIVTVAAKTEDPEKSARIVNTLNEVFLETTGALQSDTAGRAADELSGRLEELRASLDEAERKAEKFRAEHDLIGAQGRLISEDELVKLNDQLAESRARTIELNARAQSARSVQVDTVIGGGLPEALASPVMSELRAQYAVMKQQADQLSVRVGPRHPQYLAMQAQLQGARSQIGAELQRIVASVQTDLKRAVQQEQDLAARMAQLKVRSTDVNSDLVTMRELEREAAAKRAVYENYLLRAREAGEQRDINTANISVISQAYPPMDPSGPSRAVIAISGTMLGFFAGIGLGMARGIYSSLRDAGSARRAGTAVPLAFAAAAADEPAEIAGRETAPQKARTEAPAEPLSVRKDGVEAMNPFVRLMQRFRSPAIDTGDEIPHSTKYSAAGQAAGINEMPANQEPDIMQPYPQQPFAYPQSAPQPAPAPAFPYAAYPQQAVPPQPYMPQQPMPPYPPAFVHPSQYPPQFATQPAAYGYPPVVPAPPAFHGWQPQPAPVNAYGYPQPAPAPAYPSYPPMPQQQAAQWPHEARPMSQPAPEPRSTASSREMSTIEEVRESLREFREAIRDLAEDRARRRYS